MNWITGLQNTINTIEENITEEIDYTELAKKAYSSEFHFQRIFHILCGYTIGEYVRLRRLTLAGSELASSDAKVIDIALKYGYDSPESFSRAFTKFHGITPSRAKQNQSALKSFSRLSIKLILEGGNIMDYRIVKESPFQMIAKKDQFPQGKEISHEKIRSFWQKCNNDGTIETLCRYIKPGNILGNAIAGICFDNPNKGDFDYAIGVPYEGGDIPDGFSITTIPENTWAVFPCIGPMPDAFQTLWKKIYTEFFPTSEYQPSNGMCFESYPGDNVTDADYACELWISVIKK